MLQVNAVLLIILGKVFHKQLKASKFTKFFSMTRFLKLVRHEDGKWKASVPTETDDLAQVSLKERKYAPIDPDQLLKALDSLLSPEGGIRSIEDVPRLSRYQVQHKASACLAHTYIDYSCPLPITVPCGNDLEDP